MGMDQYMYRIKRPSFPVVINNYTDMNDFENDYGYKKEVMYWRRDYDINDMIGWIIGKPIENCGYYALTKDNLEKLISDLEYVYQEEQYSDDDDDDYKDEIDEHKAKIISDINDIKKIIDETDFEKYDIVYSADW